MTSYKEFIDDILETRGRFACGDEYHERHHIIPKCMNGTDEKENLIDLFAKEHFEAHRLLALENPDNKSLAYAWTMMAWIRTDSQNRYEVTPEEYEAARKRFSELSKLRKGVKIGPFSEEHRKKIGEANKGRKLSQETRKKISEALKNPSEETREKMRNNRPDMHGENGPMYGKQHTEETKRQISESKKGSQSPMKGKKHSEETKKKISESKRGTCKGSDNPNYGNHKLQGRYVGINSPVYGSGKAVIQLTKDDEFVAEYISSYEAEKITGINRNGITQVCRHINNRKTAGGFIWVFKDEYLTRQN